MRRRLPHCAWVVTDSSLSGWAAIDSLELCPTIAAAVKEREIILEAIIPTNKVFHHLYHRTQLCLDDNDVAGATNACMLLGC